MKDGGLFDFAVYVMGQLQCIVSGRHFIERDFSQRADIDPAFGGTEPVVIGRRFVLRFRVVKVDRKVTRTSGDLDLATVWRKISQAVGDG